VLVLYQTQSAGWGIGIVAAGIPVYWLRSMWLKKSSV
jgi:hypothetical protein